MVSRRNSNRSDFLYSFGLKRRVTDSISYLNPCSLSRKSSLTH
ncbi:hypothetical protein p1B133 (plasmid) [Aromatoleum aromaticum EbN1]|uniref:Uncharacterized protein n=1 Tax=Aromatoleum aromaticum (strain DSM 19018 / LMG 30748 / EbN1) TaxID=76114 RepID=Q5NX74_AROAE|nr:hypothetical protein p1B133 [Aromatoleum aromaticum EbN1]